MKKFLLLFCLVSSLLCVSQYQQKYHYVSPVYSAFEDIIPFNYGSVLVGVNNGTQAYIAHLDSTGNIVWRDSVASLNHSSCFKVIPDFNSGLFYMPGDFEATNGVDDIFCRQYNLSGSQQWQITYDTPGSFNPDKYNDADIDANGNIFIAGLGRETAPYTNALILKYDASGNKLGDTILLSNSTSQFSTLKVNGTKVYAVFSEQIGSSLSNYKIHCYDLSLNEIWNAQTSVLARNGAFMIFDVNPSNYSVIGGLVNNQLSFEILRPNGSIVNTVLINHPQFTTGLYPKLLMDNTKYIYALSDFYQELIISKHDTLGNFYWSDTIPRNFGNKANRLENFHLKDSLLYVGQFYDKDVNLYIYDTAGNRDYKVPLKINGLKEFEISEITTDSLGGIFVSGVSKDSVLNSVYKGYMAYFENLTPADTSSNDSTPGDSNTGYWEVLTLKQITVFPNPVQDYLSTNRVLKEITIFNTQGQHVLKPDELTEQIDVSELESGMYFLKGLELDGTAIMVRFLKQ